MLPLLGHTVVKTVPPTLKATSSQACMQGLDPIFAVNCHMTVDSTVYVLYVAEYTTWMKLANGVVVDSAVLEVYIVLSWQLSQWSRTYSCWVML